MENCQKSLWMNVKNHKPYLTTLGHEIWCSTLKELSDNSKRARKNSGVVLLFTHQSMTNLMGWPKMVILNEGTNHKNSGPRSNMV